MGRVDVRLAFGVKHVVGGVGGGTLSGGSSHAAVLLFLVLLDQLPAIVVGEGPSPCGCGKASKVSAVIVNIIRRHFVLGSVNRMEISGAVIAIPLNDGSSKLSGVEVPAALSSG
ncbi:hypothetical protein, partial [Planomonospora algeriensis]